MWKNKNLALYIFQQTRRKTMIPEKHNKKIIKDYSSYEYLEIDDKSFSIKPLKKMRLIDSIAGLDDECEFEKNMYNFSDDEDLPNSDRATDKRCKNN